jgi:hypothetical protein
MKAPDSAHPKQTLTFSARGPWSAHARERVESALLGLGSIRWTLGPPQVSWEPDAMLVQVQIHSALPPWGERLPVEVDEAEFRQTSSLLEALTKLSLELGFQGEVELDGTWIGTIDRGRADRGVTEVLLSEWERGLAS